MTFRLINITKKSQSKFIGKKENSTLYETVYERCVICGKLTTVRIDTPIEFRYCYEIGSGQVCYNCHRQITEEYQKQHKSKVI